MHRNSPLQFWRNRRIRLSTRAHRLTLFGGATGVVLGALLIVLAIGWQTSVNLAHAASGPSLAELDSSIARAEPFINNLYKPIDGGDASLAEYYGFPLRVYLTGYRRWILAGEDSNASCLLVACTATTEISQVDNEYARETYLIDFHSPQVAESPLIRVSIDWNIDPDHWRAIVENVAFADTATQAEVYLGNTRLGIFDAANKGTSFAITMDRAEIGKLQSFRYTVRHGNQMGIGYYAYQGNTERVDRLVSFMVRWGFRPGFDIHGPIWGQGLTYPDDMPYRVDEISGEDSYHDCSVSTTRNALAYPYESKICRITPAGYSELSRRDTLAPTVDAMHLLNKYGNAGIASATRIARDLEVKFDRQGAGIPMCTPVSCDNSTASGIRTFEFGALESMLGYQYGDPVSRRYADTVARLTLQVQVGPDAIVRTVANGDFYRPVQQGAFYLAWSNALRMPIDKPFVYQMVNNAFSMPPEYEGILSSNMETTDDAYAFLVKYRCLKYGAGCPTGTHLNASS